MITARSDLYEPTLDPAGCTVRELYCLYLHLTAAAASINGPLAFKGAMSTTVEKFVDDWAGLLQAAAGDIAEAALRLPGDDQNRLLLIAAAVGNGHLRSNELSDQDCRALGFARPGVTP